MRRLRETGVPPGWARNEGARVRGENGSTRGRAFAPGGGHHVTLLERDTGLGGLWGTRRDAEDYYLGENSYNVYQSTYHSAPALFRMIGTTWEDQFSPRHDLVRQWLRPFVRDA